MNAAAFDTLNRAGDVNYVGPINPPVDAVTRVGSRVLRSVGLPGNFASFACNRLDRIAQDVANRVSPDASIDFFHGFTPWVLTRPRRPYIAWSDCTFRDYVDIFHRRTQFRAADLDRIERAEAEWLRSARRVFFMSDWAAERAKQAYGLDPACVASVGIFGATEPPEADKYAGARDFAFVSTNFHAKGGRTVLQAFRRVRERHADATLIVVGDAPKEAAVVKGVTCIGYLRKEIPDEHARYRQILGSARAVVHPTRSDVSPLLIVEAGYFGCPVISARRFAIPELIDHGSSGWLLDGIDFPNEVADAMTRMLEDDATYLQMRRAAWRKAREQHSRIKFETRLLSLMSAT